MPSVEFNTLPIFEADQVLTSQHLNDVVNYLFEQERLTRSKLIGIGPVCGLQLRRTNDNRIAISNGVGITTQGHLVSLEAESGTETIYGFMRPYSDPNDPDYSFFLAGTEPRTLHELVTVKTDTADVLPADLSDYGVLLYLECFEKRLKNCIENDCNDKGSQLEFRVRPLLVRLADLREIICEEEQLNTPKSETEITQLMLGRYLLPQLSLERFRPGNTPIVTFQDLTTHYRGRIDGSLTSIQKALRLSFDRLQPLWAGVYGSDVVFKQNIDKLANLYQELVTNRPSLLQYFHAMLCDLVEAYNEFRDEVFDLLSACCPNPARYPKHLRLGHLAQGDTCLPSPYRTLFHHAPIHNGQQALRQRVIGLHQRLNTLLSSFRDPANFTQLRITPSRELDRPLSERAIPYYYRVNETFLRHWSPELARRCRHRETNSYHALDYNPAAEAYTRDALRYSLKPFDFLRIEGHHGRNYRQVLSQVLSERKRQNLPFDVVAVKLGRSATGTDLGDVDCHFNDLEVMCNAWKEDLACRLKSVVNQLGKASVAGSLKAQASDANTGSGSSEAEWSANTNFGYTSYYRIADTGGSRTGNILRGTTGGMQTGYQIAVAQEVRNAIPRDKQQELIGSYVYEGLKQAEDNPEVGASIAIAELKKNEAVSQLQSKDFQLAFEMPIRIMANAVAFAKSAEQTCADMNLEELELLQTRLQQLMLAYLALLAQYDNENEAFEIIVQAGAIIQMTNLFLSSCSIEQLKVILAEMQRRKAELLKRNLFYEYLGKHPGLDHAGGVPKGGTFVIVYYAEERQEKPNPNGILVGGVVQDVNGQVLPGATVIAAGTTTGTISNAAGEFQLQLPAGAYRLQAYTAGFAPIIREVFQPNQELVLVLGGDNDEPAAVLPQNGEVVADFFVPYLCCSDCPPIDYIIQQAPTEEPISLRLEPRTFCQDKPNPVDPVPFIVTPQGAEVAGAGVELTNAGYFFNPMAIPLSADDPYRVINFTVNGEPVPVTAEVELMIQADFGVEYFWRVNEETNGLEYVVQLFNNSSAHALTFSWELFLRDENGSETTILSLVTTDREAIERILTNVKPAMQFYVRLKAQSRFCDTFSEQGPFTIESLPTFVDFQLFARGTEQPIDPPVVSVEDERIFFLSISPEKGKLEQTSALQLKLEQGSAQGGRARYFFRPQSHKPGVYAFRYETADGQAANYAITLREPFKDGLLGKAGNLLANASSGMVALAGLRSSVSDNNAKLLDRTDNLLKAVSSQTDTEEGRAALRSGEGNEKLVEQIADLTNQTTKALRKTDDPQEQAVLTELLEIQTKTAVDLINVQDEDLKRTDPLAKLMTTIGNQFKKLAGDTATRGPAERLRTSLGAATTRLGATKPLANERITGLISNLRS
jgi:hypothetical protein